MTQQWSSWIYQGVLEIQTVTAGLLSTIASLGWLKTVHMCSRDQTHPCLQTVNAFIDKTWERLVESKSWRRLKFAFTSQVTHRSVSIDWKPYYLKVFEHNLCPNFGWSNLQWPTGKWLCTLIYKNWLHFYILALAIGNVNLKILLN